MKGFFFTLVLFFSFGLSHAQQFYSKTSKAEHWVDSVFKTLSPKERIAQLMVIRESGIKDGNAVIFNEDVEDKIKKYNIGSVCLFQGGPVSQAMYINHFQKLAKTPLLVCIDGETGLGMRMTDSVMKFPDQLTIGAVQDSALVYKIGEAIGEQCTREGIQVNYAPVVDINNNPNNPVINFRSFGQDKYKVATYGVAMMKGIQDQNVLACAKHFPGHGDVAVDSHLDLPVINKSMEELDSLELYPFRRMFSAGVASVMIAHLSIPAIDPTPNLPTSLSKENVTTLLRDSLNYHGISFTDALEMKGVTKYFPQGAAAVQSLIAGNDMLCLPGDIESSINDVMQAIKEKKLSWADINKKVKKVLLVKYNLRLNNVMPVDTTHLVADLNSKVVSIRRMVAAEAFTLLRLQDSTLLPLKHNKRVAYVGIGVSEANTFADLLTKRYQADSYYFNYSAGADEANAILDSVQGKYDAVIVGLHHYNKYPANNFGISDAAINLLQQLQNNPSSLTFVFGNPYAIKFMCDAPNLIECYEDDAVFQSMAVELLQGHNKAKGRLPVSVCKEYSYGTGIITDDPYFMAVPETVGLNSFVLNNIDSVANDAIRQHATPGCVVLVAKDGKVVFYRSYGYMSYDSLEPVKRNTVYDLASVTKISATTVSVMKLYEEGKLNINKTLGDYLPWVRGTDKAPLKLKDVLMHQAGLVAWIPFYKETVDSATGLPKPGFYKTIPDSVYSVRVAQSMYMRKDWVDTMYKRILESPLGPSGKYIYSDNDFIFLGKIVEQITGKPLNEYAKETFYEPLHMASTTFLPEETEPVATVAPTEKEKYFRLELLRGTVHDPGAAMFGGVAGHAGLFSNAYDLSQLYEMLLFGGEWNGVHLLKKKTIDFFTDYHSKVSRRGYGFDKPEKDNATRLDPYPTLSASPQTFGHTGFTGTCVWVDPKYNLVYIFLSNRVCPDGGENMKLIHMNVRTNIQETIYKSLIKKQQKSF